MTGLDTAKTLTQSLTALAHNRHNSEAANRCAMNEALRIVRQSSLDEDAIKAVCAAISRAANPSGWYYTGHGIEAGIEVLGGMPSEEEAVPAATIPLNRANLRNLVSDCSIFSVQLIKRTTGELRTMTCRVGVQKHLRGGAKSFSDKQKGLITVFDMQAKGYRSILVNGIQVLSIHGQSFTFAEVA